MCSKMKETTSNLHLPLWCEERDPRAWWSYSSCPPQVPFCSPGLGSRHQSGTHLLTGHCFVAFSPSVANWRNHSWVRIHVLDLSFDSSRCVHRWGAGLTYLWAVSRTSAIIKSIISSLVTPAAHVISFLVSFSSVTPVGIVTGLIGPVPSAPFRAANPSQEGKKKITSPSANFQLVYP